MAAVVRILKDTDREVWVDMINADTTETSATLKIDVSALTNAVGDGTDILELTDLTWSVGGAVDAYVVLTWDATADVPFAVLSGTSAGDHTTNNVNTAGVGITGDVMLNTSIAAARYQITAKFVKKSGFGL